MKKIGILFSTILIPTLAFADGGTNAVALFGTIVLILLTIGLVGLISAFFYLKKGNNKMFYLSGVTASIIFTFSVFFMASTPQSSDYFDNFLILPSLIIFGIIFYKKTKDNRTLAFWYYASNTTSILLVSNLLQLLNNFELRFLYYIDYGFYAFYSFLYVRTIIEQEKPIKNIKLFAITSIICFLTYLSITAFYMLTNNHLEYIMENAISTIGQLFTGFFTVLFGSAVGTFIAIKNYR